MPTIVRGQAQHASIISRNYSYKYPKGTQLRPGTPYHEKLLQMILDRASAAKAEKDKRNPAWSRTDATLTAYIPLDDAERALKKKDSRKPVSIVVPYSYASLETILTYLTTSFISQRPIFPYDSVSSEDTVACKLLEVLVDRQMDYFKGALSLYTWMRDGLAYGIGACAPLWKRDTRWVTRPTTRQLTDVEGNPIGEETVNMRSPQTVFEGTELNAIGPRFLLLDPNSSPHRQQDAEFIGWIEETNQLRLLDLEKGVPEQWFNARYVKAAGPSQSKYNVSEGLYTSGNSMLPTTLIHMYVNIIPEEYDLPANEGNQGGVYPEKWLFTVADDWCIIRAERLEASHGKYPIAINAPDFDGYSTYPISRLEVIQGLQTTLDWLFNSHIANVRKMINNMLVIDPTLVDTEKLKETREGGLIYLKASAWGKGVKDAVHQLAVQDVTSHHISDAGTIIDMMQRVSGATDNMMGSAAVRSDRVSAAEAKLVGNSSSNRIAKLALLVSIQGFRDLGMFLATNTQDYMKEDVQLKVLGSWPSELKDVYAPGTSVLVTPNQLAVPFDVITRDGSVSNQTQYADTWVQMYQTLAQNPALAQQFDMFRVFSHIAMLMGAKNVNDFKAAVTQTPISTIPDETALQGAKAGNLVPASQIIPQGGM